MTTGSVIIAIVAIVAFTVMRIVRYNTEHAHHRRHEGPVVDDAEKIALRREVEELRERIHVLERIATDGGEAKRIAAEIENLRDK